MGTTCAFLLMIVKTFLEVAKQKNVYSDFDQYDFCQAAIDGFKDCCKIWKSKPIFTFLLITVIIWDSAVFLSQINTCARIAYAAEESVKAGIEALLNYERETNAKPIGKQNVPEVSVSISTSILLSEEKMNNCKESLNEETSLYTYSEQEMIEQFGEENYREAKNIIVSANDRNRELYLSSTNYNALFHLDGEYKIENWNDQEEIDSAVLRMIMDEISLGKQNIFDAYAPGWLQTNIKAASEKEKAEHTFNERIEIIGTRGGAYGMYPKSSLAQLIANDNQAMALALVLIKGKVTTELYYYGESIFWGVEYLGFADISTSAVKEKVNWIAERYKDILFICSETDPEYMYAEKLMIAYKHAADEF